MVANATVSIKAEVKDGLAEIEGKVLSEVEKVDARISAKVDSIKVPTLPDIPPDLGKVLQEIYDAIPGEEDFEKVIVSVTADVVSAVDAKIASMEGVKQKALYDWMNANEKGFAGLDAEAQATQLAGLDLTSMALSELAQIKMSPTQARKTPFMAMAVNLGRSGAAQALMALAQAKQEGHGHTGGPGQVRIENRHRGPGIYHE